MGLFKWANDCVKKLKWIDVKLCSLYGMFLGVIAVKLFPVILDYSIWYYVGAAALVALRLIYVILFGKKCCG